MANTEYKFDPHSLKYHEVYSKKSKIIKTILTQFVAIVVISVIFYIAFAYIIETPQQKTLKRENKKLEEQYQYLSNKYNQTEKVLDELVERDKSIYRAIFESEPPSEDGNKIDISLYDSLSNSKLAKFNTLSTESILIESQNNQNSYKDLFQIILTQTDELRYIPAIQPIPNKDLRQVIYGFGMRTDPVYKTASFHSGIDFAAPKGTQVFATADGKVTQANQKKRGLGKHIEIDHGNGFVTIYAHLSDMEVRRGSKVERGQIIGYVGNTGKSLVSHLHYEVEFKGKKINPVHFFFLELTPDQYSKIMIASSRGGISLD